MAFRYFRGRIDIGRLTLMELSAAAEVLATLERLASEGLIGFEMGVARVRYDRLFGFQRRDIFLRIEALCQC